MRFGMNAVLLAGTLATASLVAPTASSARTPYDGNWSVVLVTDQGDCDRSYRYGLQIINGQLVYVGDPSVQISGRVANNGAIRVSLQYGDQGGSAVGRLTRTAGGGNWSSPSLGCAGRWSAERR